jgi:hypothetical protein
MEFFINEVDQVMKRIIEDTFTEETPVGMEKQYEKLELADRTIYQWNKFDLSQGKYVVDPTNTTSIVIDSVSYVPVNGAVEVMKQQIVTDIEVDEEKVALFEAVIELDSRVTNLEGGM